MGNLDSKGVGNVHKSHAFHNKKKLESVEPALSESQILLLLDSWDVLKHDISKVGVVMFMK